MPDGSRIASAPEPSRGEIAQDLFRDHIDLARLNRTLKGSVNRSNAAISTVQRPAAASQPPRELQEERESVVEATDEVSDRFQSADRATCRMLSQLLKITVRAAAIASVVTLIWPSSGLMIRSPLPQVPDARASLIGIHGAVTGAPISPEVSPAPGRARALPTLPPLSGTDGTVQPSRHSGQPGR